MEDKKSKVFETSNQFILATTDFNTEQSNKIKKLKKEVREKELRIQRLKDRTPKKIDGGFLFHITKVSEILKDKVECSICYCSYNSKETTKIKLHCSHTYCERCLIATEESNREAGRPIRSCPMCRRRYRTKPKDVDFSKQIKECCKLIVSMSKSFDQFKPRSSTKKGITKRGNIKNEAIIDPSSRMVKKKEEKRASRFENIEVIEID